MTDTGLPEDDRALAGEYVLGLLGPAEAASARARIVAERAFAAEVWAWRERFAVLDEETAPVPPPAAVRAAIEARLFPPGPRRGLRGLLAGLVTAGLVAAAGFVALAPLPQPVLSASLGSADAALRLRVGVLPDAAALHVVLEAGAAPEGRVLQLWAIAEGQNPVPLGLIEAPEVLIEAFPPDLVRPGATLAVSEEPPGGSPTGLPTGEVLAAAPLVEG